ncbi:MAG: DNA double strand-break repair protein Rad50 [Candidatus Phytoplasma pruni]|nr:DNA double strand-break repair protein Rad50 [Candidatus Phytoplasma pruni]
MKTPLDLIKTYLTFKSYFTWFLMATIIFGIFFFFKNKLSPNQTTNTHTWQGYLISFLIILGLLSFIYLCFFKKPKEPSSKYAGQLVQEIDKAIDKYDEIINGYQGLKDNWEQELAKVEAELKELYEAKEATQEQKAKIKEALNKNEDKIKAIKEQIKNTSGNITILKGQLQQKEAELVNKEKDIKTKEAELKTTTNTDDKKRLQEEISKLQDERLALVKQISAVKVQIGQLESKQTMYEDMLSRTENFKKMLEEQYKDLTEGDKKLYNQIQSVEQRRNEIQKNIDEIEEKKAAIDARIEGLRIMQTAADAAKSAADDWDKKHEFSFGNLRDAIFKGADMWLDAYGGRGMLKAIGGGIFKKTAGTIAKGGLIVHEVHRTVHLAQQLMQNEDGTPKMMSKETYDIIRKRIEKDLDEANADYKDAEKKLVDYKHKLYSDRNIKEFGESKTVVLQILQKEASVINEYAKIIDELDENRKAVSQTQKLATNRNQLQEKLENKNVEIDARKEELKQKSPNYTKVQERVKQRRYQKYYTTNDNNQKNKA